MVPDTSMVPTNLQDTGALDELFSVFDRNYTITDAGGNSMAVVRLIQSTTSIYLSSHLKVKTTIKSCISVDHLYLIFVLVNATT